VTTPPIVEIVSAVSLPRARSVAESSTFR
jgi:hypothetical protein